MGAPEARPAAAARCRTAWHRQGRPGGDARRARADDAAVIAVGDVQGQAERVLDAVERAVVGKRDALELVLLGVLRDGHVPLEDFPGLAKTLLARSFARVS